MHAQAPQPPSREATLLNISKLKITLGTGEIISTALEVGGLYAISTSHLVPHKDVQHLAPTATAGSQGCRGYWIHNFPRSVKNEANSEQATLSSVSRHALRPDLDQYIFVVFLLPTLLILPTLHDSSAWRVSWVASCWYVAVCDCFVGAQVERSYLLQLRLKSSTRAAALTQCIHKRLRVNQQYCSRPVMPH